MDCPMHGKAPGCYSCLQREFAAFKEDSWASMDAKAQALDESESRAKRLEAAARALVDTVENMGFGWMTAVKAVKEVLDAPQ